MTKAKVSHMSKVFGEIIARHRKQKGWTIAALAATVELSHRHMGLLESGYNMPSYHTLFLLAEVFGVRPSDIVREVEERVRVLRQSDPR